MLHRYRHTFSNKTSAERIEMKCRFILFKLWLKQEEGDDIHDCEWFDSFVCSLAHNVHTDAKNMFCVTCNGSSILYTMYNKFFLAFKEFMQFKVVLKPFFSIFSSSFLKQLKMSLIHYVELKCKMFTCIFKDYIFMRASSLNLSCCYSSSTSASWKWNKNLKRKFAVLFL